MLGKILGKALSLLDNETKKQISYRLGFGIDYAYLDTTTGSHNHDTRTAWIEATLKKIPANYRLLDAGAGEQPFRKACNHLQYVSQDIAQYTGDGDGRGFQRGVWDFGKLDIVCDLANVPEPTSSFDAILCTEVIEHVPDPLAVIRELSRLTKKGGYLILTAPFCSLTHFAPYHYSTGFNRYYYEKHLPDNGFQIIDLQENGNFFEYLAQELNRINHVSSTYTKSDMDYEETISIKRVLKMLERFSQDDTQSKELLCFGYQVFAQKIA